MLFISLYSQFVISFIFNFSNKPAQLLDVWGTLEFWEIYNISI